MSFGFGFGLVRGITQGTAVPDPVLGISFVGPGPLNPTITFSRASGATVVGNDGYMDNSATNSPRFDYNPVDRSPRGLLIEQASTNQLLYVEQLSKPNWANVNCGIVSNNAQSPFSAVKAEQIVSSAAGAAYIQQNIISTSATYTFSVFLKVATTDNGVRLVIYDVTTSTQVGQYTAASIPSGTPYAGGWYRHTMTVTTATIGNSLGFRIFTDSAATGNGTSIVAFGAQAEPGLTFPTSYMRSFGTAFARSADVASITGTSFSSWFNGTTGTFYAEGAPITSTPTPYSFLLEGNNAGAAATASIGTGGSTTTFGLDARIGGISNNSKEDIGITYTAGGIIKSSVSYDTGATTFGLVLNGSVISATANAGPQTATSLYIGSRGGSTNFWNGWVRSVRFYNSKLTNAQMQSITA